MPISHPTAPADGPPCYNLFMTTSQTVIVTGASSGIGRATALRFGRAGASITLVGRDSGALQEVSAQVERDGGRPAIVVADVTQADAPDRIVSHTLSAFGAISALVNAAGIIANGSAETTTDGQWDEMLDINVRAPFRLMRAAAPALVASTRRDRQRLERDRACGRSRTCSPIASARPPSIS